MSGYIRQDVTNNIADGNVINASDFDNEYNAIEAAFHASTGHTHDGTAAEGAPITKIGPTQDVVASASALTPKTDNTVDLGSSTLEYKDLWIDGTANIDSLVADTADINAGTIDGVSIGSAVRGSGAFTTLDANGNSTLGDAVGDTVTINGTTTFVNAAPTLTPLTASQAVFTNGSKTLVSNAITGTGNVVMSASPTLTGTIGGASMTLSSLTSGRVTYAGASGLLQDSANFTFNGTDLTVSGAVNAGSVNATTLDLTNLEVTNIKAKDGTASMTLADATGVASFSANPVFSGGTANGVLYLDGSKVATSGSALTFDGTNLGVGGAPTTFGKLDVRNGVNYRVLVNGLAGYGNNAIAGINDAGSETHLGLAGTPIAFYVQAAEQMRLTSTGLGIGTTSPAGKLDARGTGYIGSDSNNALVVDSTSTLVTIGAAGRTSYSTSGLRFLTSDGTAALERMRLDSSGNLGLGVTPSASSGAAKVFEVGSAGNTIRAGANDVWLTGNAYFNTGWKYGTNTFATAYNQTSGTHTWFTAPSGTAGNAITFTQAMTLDASGNLGLGVTPSAWSIIKAIEIGSFKNSVFSDNGSVSVGIASGSYYNAGWKYALTGSTVGYYEVAGNAHRWFSAPSGTAGNAITFTQAMTLDASGNLLVGTTSSSGLGRVEVVGGSGVRINEDASGTKVLSLRSDFAGSGPAINVTTSHPLLFLTGNTERARITSGGDLLVGKTASDDTTAGNRITTSYMSSAGTQDYWLAYNTSATAYRFYVTAAGTVFATNTTISAISDRRFKENIVDLDAGLDAVMALKPRKFDWKAGKGKDIKGDRGFIAQEFEQVFPDLIDEWKDPAPEGEEPYKSVRQDLIPVLVKAIQELKAELDATKARLAALES